MSPKDRAPMGKGGRTMAEANAVADSKSERELQRLLGEYLRKWGIPYNVSRFDKKTTGTPGWPDFTFPFKGKFYALECKSEEGKLSEDQENCERAIKANGGEYHVIRKLQQVKELLFNTPF
jgi:hypothetical protein